MVSSNNLKNRTEFANRLRALVDEKYGGADARLIKASGVKANVFSRWVTGKGLPSFEQLVLICEFSGASPTWLMTGEGPMFSGAAAAEPLDDDTDPVHQAAMWKREALSLEKDRDAWRKHAGELLDEMARRRPGGGSEPQPGLLNDPGPVTPESPATPFDGDPELAAAWAAMDGEDRKDLRRTILGAPPEDRPPTAKTPGAASAPKRGAKAKPR